VGNQGQKMIVWTFCATTMAMLWVIFNDGILISVISAQVYEGDSQLPNWYRARNLLK
jgi:hypothetical protein